MKFISTGLILIFSINAISCEIFSSINKLETLFKDEGAMLEQLHLFDEELGDLISYLDR